MDFVTAEREITDYVSRHRDIIEVTRGVEPEEGTRTYYILMGGATPSYLEHGITLLDLRLHREKDTPMFEIFGLPYRTESERDAFIGESIWRRKE